MAAGPVGVGETASIGVVSGDALAPAEVGIMPITAGFVIAGDPPPA
ncbi:MAG: hypothetical protein M3Q71_07930 [Chloroflexota bacterium]|nr:hypothetical protein [Chloroflexota bacterium]